jgi:hypothetical protein
MSWFGLGVILQYQFTSNPLTQPKKDVNGYLWQIQQKDGQKPGLHNCFALANSL